MSTGATGSSDELAAPEEPGLVADAPPQAAGLDGWRGASAGWDETKRVMPMQVSDDPPYASNEQQADAASTSLILSTDASTDDCPEKVWNHGHAASSCYWWPGEDQSRSGESFSELSETRCLSGQAEENRGGRLRDDNRGLKDGRAGVPGLGGISGDWLAWYISVGDDSEEV